MVFLCQFNDVKGKKRSQESLSLKPTTVINPGRLDICCQPLPCEAWSMVSGGRQWPAPRSLCCWLQDLLSSDRHLSAPSPGHHEWRPRRNKPPSGARGGDRPTSPCSSAESASGAFMASVPRCPLLAPIVPIGPRHSTLSGRWCAETSG